MVSPSATWPGLTKIGYGPGEPGVYYPSGERTFFRVVPADDIQVKVGMQFIKDQDYKSVYIVSARDAYAQGQVNLMLANIEDAKIALAGQSDFDEAAATDEDIQTIVTAIEAAEPDVIYFAPATGGRALDMFKAMHESNPERPIVGSDYLIGSGMADGTDFSNVYATVFQIKPDQTTSLTEFVKKYEDKYKVKPTEYVITSYEAAKVLFDAIARAGSAPTRESVLKALRETKDYNGVLGTWSFDDNGDTSYATFSLLALQNGAWTPLNNASD
jgi:branched-chain amino acid transport system substrate-binding protein